MSPEIHLASPEETTALARAIAPHLGAGDTFLLEGPIGSGKTHFARAIIKARLAAIGLDEDVPSPTFTLVQTYDAGDAEIWHADLYRLGHAAEVAELGLEDAFATAICLVEWPDRLASALPEQAIRLTFAALEDEHSRLLTVSGNTARWTGLLRAGAVETARAG